MNFGYKVQKLREEANISLKDFAYRMHTTTEAMWECENENRIPRPDVILRIADFFKVSVEELFEK